MKLFVYGTLKKGFPNNYLLGNSKYLGKAITAGKMYNIDSKFPAVVPGKSVVYGELYKVSQDILDKVDLLEGFDKKDLEGSLYVRKIITCVHNKKIIPAYGYIWNYSIAGFDLVKGGKWGKF